MEVVSLEGNRKRLKKALKMKFKSILIVLLAAFVIATLIVETECHMRRGNHLIKKRRARKVRDIMSLRKKAIDDGHKKKRSLMRALKQSLYNSDKLL